MATSLVCLPQYAYSAVQFRKCVVYMGHTTHFTSATLLGEEEIVSLLLVFAVSLYLFRLQFSCC